MIEPAPIWPRRLFEGRLGCIGEGVDPAVRTARLHRMDGAQGSLAGALTVETVLASFVAVSDAVQVLRRRLPAQAALPP